MSFSKLSSIILLQSLTPFNTDRRLAVLLGISIAAWGVTALIATAFQCHVPRTWDYINNECFNRVRLVILYIYSSISVDDSLIYVL